MITGRRHALWCRHFFLVLSFGLLFISIPSTSQAQDDARGKKKDAAQQAADEVARLRKLAARQKGDDEIWKDVKPGIEAGLERVGRDLDARRLLVALRGLAGIRTNLLAYTYAAARPQVAQGGMAAFESEWRRVDGELKRSDKKYQAAQWGAAPAAVRAIAEASWATARPLYEASRDYALATQPRFGLFYMGQAQAAVDYAQFLRTLRFDARHGDFAARSLAADVDGLEARIEAAYQPPLSIERHPDFININAWVKRAVEMDRSRLYHGVLYAYLEATRSLGELLVAPPTKGEMEKLKEARAAFAARLAQAGRDHSVGALYVELAGREMERAEAGEANAARTARVLIEQVMPAYFAVLERSAAAAAVASPPVVTVTLVRWPFT